MNPLKNEIAKLIIVDLKKSLAGAERSRAEAIEEPKHHKGAMESRYDTFKEEAQYMMSAQEIRAAEFESHIIAVERMDLGDRARGSIGAIIETEETGKKDVRRKYFILPAGGGNTYEIEGQIILTLNVKAPLAQKLIGSQVDDEVVVVISGKTRSFLVVSVC